MSTPICMLTLVSPIMSQHLIVENGYRLVKHNDDLHEEHDYDIVSCDR
jgi:hypothetical protein